MDDELLGYYHAELSYIRDAGAEFAVKYPKVAARLYLEADKCEDPHVERLLEGFAFLAARIRKKLDDELPEITDALLNVLYPHFQRPLPSMTVVQFLPGPEQSKLTGGYRVERGTRVNSRPVAGAPCRFQTGYPVTLWPVEVAAARLDPDRVVFPGKPPQAVALLQIGLRATGGLSFGQLELDRLRFYIDGEGPLAFGLYELLLNNTCRLLVRGAGPDGQVRTVTLPPQALQPVGLGRDEGLFPYPDRSFPGYRLIQEYFAFPEKFLFFEVSGLECLRQGGFGDSAELLFFLDQPPRGDLPVGPENFRLGCTPIINLFSQVCEPIPLTHTVPEYRVVPDVHRPLATEVYSIDEVISVGSFLGEVTQYEPFYGMRHGMSPGAQAYWFSSRRPSTRKDDRGTEVYLSFVDPGFNPRLPATETITVHATCTNRDLPGRLPFGGDQGDFELEAQAPVGRVRCLRKPTRPLRPPLGRAGQWRLISLLALNHLSLADTAEGLDALREALTIYDFADTAVTRQQIAGLSGVSSRRVSGRVSRGAGVAVCQGLEVTLEFDEAQYVGSGVYLLASVLERFLGLYASINSFCQLVAKTKQREGILKRWPPRAGERTLL
ncbi:MAG TPA: type VI secretion system baseplate subunit TssF [Isosphaeraceae bacterium]